VKILLNFFSSTDFIQITVNLAQKGYQSCWFGDVFVVFINNPENVKILMNHEHCFEKPARIYNIIFKYGLMTEGGEKYKAQRKSLNPLFSPSNLEYLIPFINESYKYYLHDKSQMIERGEIEMRDLSVRFTFSNAFNTLFGIHPQIIPRDEVEKLMENVCKLLGQCSSRLSRIWMHPDFVYKLTKEYKTEQVYRKNITNLMQKIYEKHDAKNSDRITFFSCMKHHLGKMEYEEYCESMNMFAGASNETTASAISFIFFFLALHQDKQEKLYNEISSILSSSHDEVTRNMMNKMCYMELVIKESLRLLPVANFIAREATNDVEFSKLHNINVKLFHHLHYQHPTFR
jgi:cytochrome P450